MRISGWVAGIVLAWAILAAAPSALTQTVIATVTVGYNPQFLAINRATNTIYVTNHDDNTVSAINGNTHAISMAPVGSTPGPMAVNPSTNMIYLSLPNGNAIAAISGWNLHGSTVATGRNPWMTRVDSARNRLYATNYADSTVTAIDGSNQLIGVVPAGNGPAGIAINSNTNNVYVAGSNSGTVTVIDGSTLTIGATIQAGAGASAIAVDSLRNKIYVANATGSSVTVIDGSNNSARRVAVGANPTDIALNVVTDHIYVVNHDSATVSVIDGRTLITKTIANVGGAYTWPQHVVVDQLNNQIYVLASSYLSVGLLYRIDGASNSISSPVTLGHCSNDLALNEVTHRLYVSNGCDHSVSVLSVPTAPSRFIPVPPCRAVDTRYSNGAFGGPFIAATTARAFNLGYGSCDIPSTASAYSLNLTVLPHGALGYVSVWPAGLEQPMVSTLNSFDGRVKANALIVPAGADSGIALYATHDTDVVLDINGYFEPATYNGALAFYPVLPCRVVDTRDPNGPLGGPYLHGDTSRDFPVLSSNCKLANNAQAYSMNFTAIPRSNALWYLSVWPSDQQRPVVSTLNSFTGTVVANAAIVPAAGNGNISAYVSNDADLVIDVNGYFAPPGQNGLSLYAMSPCRVFDSRWGTGAFSGEVAVTVTTSACAPPPSALSYVFNATVVPQGSLGFLSLWPDGQQQPWVSNLNAFDGAVASNMAIVPTTNGWIDAYAAGSTDLILDISGYFAP